MKPAENYCLVQCRYAVAKDRVILGVRLECSQLKQVHLENNYELVYMTLLPYFKYIFFWKFLSIKINGQIEIFTDLAFVTF